ncbi:MAG: hypothetical protein ACLUD2_13675 [Clostridium sp.]
MSSFCHSLVCALAAGLLSSFVGILLAYYTRRRKIRGMAAAEFAASLPYIIPGTFFGLGYVAAFSHPPFLLRGTMWIILLNCAFRQISVGCKAVNGAFAAIDEKRQKWPQEIWVRHGFGNFVWDRISAAEAGI